MYIPKHNLMTSNAEAIEFMQRFSFATVVTAANNWPVATHLPFVVGLNGESIVLTSHFAKANDQWRAIENHKVLVIFSEPHAYISPRHYEKPLNVPTWNYIAVHAYGQGKLLKEPAEAIQVLEKTIDNYEAAYGNQWDSFPEDYKSKMLNGIVAFEITVTHLEGKKKLSQNRSETGKENIVNAFSQSKDANENVIAAYMKANLDQTNRLT